MPLNFRILDATILFLIELHFCSNGFMVVIQDACLRVC